MSWKNIIKAPPLTPEEEKLIQEEMRFRNLDRATAEKRIRRKTGKLGQRQQPTYEDYMRNYKAEEEEDLPEDVKRARERVRQGLPSIEQPLIPQFDDEKRMKKNIVRNSLGGVSAKDMHEYLQGELYKLRDGPTGLTKMDIKILELLQAVDQHGLGE